MEHKTITIEGRQAVRFTVGEQTKTFIVDDFKSGAEIKEAAEAWRKALKP